MISLRIDSKVMEIELFKGASLKIERANQLIDQLNDIFSAFGKTNFYRVYVEKDTETGESALMSEMIGEVPEDIPLYIGDIIHNLRAALDHVAYELVSFSLPDGHIPSKQTCFPFGKTREKCIESIQKGAIKGVAPEIVDLIRDAIQPYGGGNDALFALHDLDIVDKHHMLLPMFYGSAVVIVEENIGMKIKLTRYAAGCMQGGKTCAIRVPGDIEIQGNPQPVLMVLFQNIEIFRGKPVIPTLQQLSQLVSGIVQQIAEKFCARRALS